MRIAYSVFPVMHFVGGGFLRELGIFAQMYAKMLQEHNVFYVQYVIKNGNETGSDLVLIVGVLLYDVFTDFKMALFLNGSARNKVVSSQSHHSPSL